MAVALIIWFAALATIGAGFPQAVRQFGIQFFYLGYLLGILGLWALLLGGILLAFFIPIAMIHDTFVHAYTGVGRRPRQHEMAALVTYFSIAFFAGWVLPVWSLLVMCESH